MNENKDIERRLDDTQPTLEEIAVRECGCPCGAENCEFASDFIGANPNAVLGRDDAEYAEDLAAMEAEEELVADTEDYAEQQGAEFSEELSGYEDYLVPAAPEFGPGIPVEFPVPDAFKIGGDDAETPAFDAQSDNGEAVYSDTVDYTMISRDPSLFDTQGS